MNFINEKKMKKIVLLASALLLSTGPFSVYAKTNETGVDGAYEYRSTRIEEMVVTAASVEVLEIKEPESEASYYDPLAWLQDAKDIFKIELEPLRHTHIETPLRPLTDIEMKSDT